MKKIKIFRKIYKWCTKTRLRKILSTILAVLIFLTSIRYIFFFRPDTAKAADVYIKFDEGYGTSNATNDTNSTVAAGTITNATWKTEDLCKSGKCLYFDGTGDYVTYADSSSLDMAAADTVTVEAWFRTTAISSGTRTLISKIDTTTASDGGYKITMNSSGQIIFGIDSNNTSFPSYSATSTNRFDDNNWHHVAAVKNGTTNMTLYIDGVLAVAATAIASTDASNTDSFIVGRDTNNTSNDWNGFIDEVKVLRTARTAAQVKTDYAGETKVQGTSASFGPDQSWISNGLSGYWKMDDTSASSGISFVQKNSVYGATDLTLTNVTAGSLLIAFASGAGNTTTTSVKDSTNNRTFTALTARNGTTVARIFYLANATAGTTTFALTAGGLTDPGWSIHEYSGLDTSTPFDTENWHDFLSATASWDSNSVSTAQADELLFAGVSEEEAPDNFTWTGSFTERTAEGDHAHETADRIVSSQTSYTATGSWGSSRFGVFLIAAFKAPAASPGNATDSSGNGVTLTNNGSTAFTAGKFAKAAGTFDGSSKYFSTATAVTGVKTVSFWAYPASNTNNYFNLASGKYLTSTSGTLALTGFSADAKIYVNGTPSTTVTANTWQLITVTDTTGISADTIRFGQANGSYYANGGYLDEIRIYNRTLSSTEVKKLYDWTPGPVGYWKMDEGTGTTINDSSGNSNSGTLTNGPAYATGKYGGGVNFDGADDFITTPNSTSISPTSGITIGGWVKMGTSGFANTSDSNQGIVDKGDYQFYLSKSDGKAYWVVNDATAAAFSALTDAGGANNLIHSLAVWNGNLYLGGAFTSIGTCSSNCNDIAKWDGSTFTALSTGANGLVYSLAVWNGNLYVGGAFTTIGTCASNCNYIAKWDGSTFTALSTGADINVYSLAVWNGNLYVGGAFTTIGTCASNCNRIAKWNGSTFSALSTGANTNVYALAVWNGNLYVGGAFTTIGTCTSNCGYIAKWNGSTFSALSTGAGASVRSMAVWNSNLYVGGTFTTIGTCSSNCNYLAKWDGSTFSALSTGANNHVYTMTSWNGNLYVGGVFTTIGTCSSNCNYLAKWDGSTFIAISTGASSNTHTMAVWNGNLYVGGNFATIGTCSSNCNYIAKLGTSATKSVSSITSSWTASTWYYISATYDGSSMKLYVNGILEGTATGVPSSLANQSLALLIGKMYGSQNGGGGGISSDVSGELFSGTLDDIRIYNYARTSAQIMEDMNTGKPTNTKPLGYWKMDEGTDNTCSGGTNDVCNSGYGGTLLDGAESNMAVPGTSTSGWTNSGKFEKALNFDNSNDVVSLGSDTTIDDLPANGMSISAWINPVSIGENSRGIIMAKNTGDTPSSGWILQTVATNALKFSVDGSTDLVVQTSNNVITLGAWNHVLITWDGVIGTASSVHIYVNGNEVGYATQTNGASRVSDASSTLYIGNDSAGTSTFDGTIDEVKLYGITLTVDQVKVEYNRGANVTMGALSTTSTGASSNSSVDSYCPPGQGTTCVGPVGEWKFDENTGTSSVYDTSGNGNIGTITNFSGWKVGKLGSSLEFNNSNTKVNVGSATVLDNLKNTGLTAEAWIYPRTVNANSSRIFDKASTSGTNRWILVLTTSRSLNFLHSCSPTSDLSVTSNPLITLGTWQHVAVTWTGGTAGTSVSFYINGVLAGYGSTPTDCVNTLADDSANDLSIGDTNATATRRPFDGFIDNAKIYNYVRTPAQIAWDYNYGKPVGWWKMDEASGTTANDSSGNSNTGTITAGSGSFGSGKYNNAYTFDATTTVVNAGSGTSLDNLPANGMSLSAWVNPSSQGEGSAGVVMAKNVGTSPSAGWLLQIAGTNALTFTVDGSTDLVRTTSNSVLTTSAWNHIVVTWDGVITTASSVHIYVNGKEVSYATTTNGAARVDDASSTFYIGNDSTSARTFDGKIDDARAYNYALTLQQIQLLYNNGAVNFTQ